MTSGSPTKPPGSPRWSDGEAVGHVARRVDRELVLGREERRVVVDLAVGPEPVPDRERHAEEPLAADEPVGVQAFDPRLVALAHVRRVPVQLAATGEERVAQLRLAATVAEVPLARRDDLERASTPLVELHRVRDRLRLADELAGLAQQLDDARLRLLGGLARELRVARRRRRARRSPQSGGSATMRPSRPMTLRVGSWSSRHHTTSVVSPNVQIIAMPEPFSGSASGCASTGTVTPNSGVVTVGAEAGLVPLVVGVRDQRDARRDQLGPRGLDDDVAADRRRRGTRSRGTPPASSRSSSSACATAVR